MRIAVVGATGLVGSAVVAAAEHAGHDIVPLSKKSGTDVLKPDGLDLLLRGVQAMINVVQSPSLEETASRAFFSAATSNLAAAARSAGVGSTVVLSIVGVDQVAAGGADEVTGFDGYYRVKYQQELDTAAQAPGTRIVRSTQFHDIARQAIGWGRDGDHTTIPDLRIRPVAVSALAQVLLDATTGEIDGDLIEVGGPQEEQVADMSARYAAHVGDAVTVIPAPVGAAVQTGILMPHAGAHLVGPTFAEWLQKVQVPAPTR